MGELLHARRAQTSGARGPCDRGRARFERRTSAAYWHVARHWPAAVGSLTDTVPSGSLGTGVLNRPAGGGGAAVGALVALADLVLRSAGRPRRHGRHGRRPRVQVVALSSQDCGASTLSPATGSSAVSSAGMSRRI